MGRKEGRVWVIDFIVPGEMQYMEKGFTIVLVVRSATLSIQRKDQNRLELIA